MLCCFHGQLEISTWLTPKWSKGYDVCCCSQSLSKLINANALISMTETGSNIHVHILLHILLSGVNFSFNDFCEPNNSGLDWSKSVQEKMQMNCHNLKHSEDLSALGWLEPFLLVHISSASKDWSSDWDVPDLALKTTPPHTFYTQYKLRHSICALVSSVESKCKFTKYLFVEIFLHFSTCHLFLGSTLHPLHLPWPWGGWNIAKIPSTSPFFWENGWVFFLTLIPLCLVPWLKNYF